MIEVSFDPGKAGRRASVTRSRPRPAFTTGGLGDTGPLPVDRVVSAFWTEIRALLFAGFGPSDIAGILGRALSEMGYGDAIASIDFTSEIEQLSAMEQILL